MSTEANTAAARVFLRSLNVLLKFARLYGFEHARTAAHFRTTWDELQAALFAGSESGLLLGATGNELLLDGVPLKAAGAERSFAQLLSAAGLASIHFSPRVTQEDLARFVRAFPTGMAKSSGLVEQLKAALDCSTGIRLNEIRFVAEDSAISDIKLAAQLTARALEAGTDELKSWLNDPQKLLQLIVAAEGSRGGPRGSGGGRPGGQEGTGSASADLYGVNAGAGGALTGEGSGGGATRVGGWAAASASLRAGTGAFGSGLGQSDSWTGTAGWVGLKEADVLAILHMLAQLGKASREQSGALEPRAFQQRLSALPTPAQVSLRQALASLAAQAPTDQPEEPLLVKLAEHLAVRFALDSYERGEVRVNAVRQLIHRLSKEVDGLRKVLGAYEEKMALAGILVESHADILDQQFWAEVPEANKRSVLLSPEAWCVPPRNIRCFLQELLRRGEVQTAHDILLNYISGISHEDPEARRNTAMGLAELTELTAMGDGHLLIAAIRQVAARLTAERDSVVEILVSAAFVRLVQEAATKRCFEAMQQALASMETVEKERPALGQSLRPRVGIVDRVPEFLEEALRAQCAPKGLIGLLRLMPQLAAEQLAARFGRSGFREDCDRLVQLATELDPEGVAHLRHVLKVAPAAEAVETVGLLSRLDPATLEQWLPKRLRDWQRSSHDRVVRRLAAGIAPGNARLLVALFDQLDPFIRALALDEIGMSGDHSSASCLMRLAEGELPEGSTPYLRLKAIEALGRLCAAEATNVLRQIVEAKRFWRWVYHQELRIAAAQALQKIDPEWAEAFLPRSGLDAAEMALAPLDPEPDSPCIRQRRYPRLRLARPLAAVTTNLREDCRMEIKVMNLGGGVAICDRYLNPGTQMALQIKRGTQTVRLEAFVRDARAQALGFEIATMDLEDRARLRRQLVDLGGRSPLPSPGSRSRRRGREIAVAN